MDAEDVMVQRAAQQAGSRLRWRWVGLAGLLIAEAMNLLDATVTQVAAPTIRIGLGGSAADIQWFSAAYTLSFAVLLITGGRLGDMFGRRHMFRIGVIGFMVASLACAVAPNPATLIGCRAVQGATAAAIIPQTIGLIKALFDGTEVAKALGTIGPVMGLAGVAGPVLGGILTHVDVFGVSWRAIFLINPPLCLVALALTIRITEDRAPCRPRLDPVGTILVIGAAALIVYPIIGGASQTAVSSPRSWLIIGAGIAVLGLFAAHQRQSSKRGGNSLLETSLFRSQRFPAALVTSILFFGVMNGLMLVVVVYLQLGVHSGSLSAGLTLLPWSAGLAIASYAAGARLVPRYGDRVMLAGIGILVVGLILSIWVYQVTPSGRYPVLLLPALGVCGLGIGLFSPAFFTSALHPLRPQEIGSAAGLLNAVQQLGATLGVAVFGTVFFAYDTPRSPAQASCAVGLVFVLAVLVIAATAATAALMADRRR